jgi:hypothetical protein
MTFLANLPATPVLVRKEYLYNFEKGHGEYEEGWWVSVKSIRGRALLFETLLSNGALYDKLPISAFCWKACDAMPLSTLQLWDNLSNNIQVIHKEFISGMRVKVLLKDRTFVDGEYCFTIDYQGWGTLSQTAQEHKSQNLIKLDNGNFALQPNNRVLFNDASLTTPTKPDYIASQVIWTCEGTDSISFSNDDKFFYEGETK